MKNISINILLTVFCLIGFMSSSDVQAQNTTDKVYISGHIVNEKDSIGKSRIWLYAPIFTISPLRETTGGYSDSLDTKNRFSLEFDNKDLFQPETNKLGKVSIMLVPENRDIKTSLADYPVEPGDSIHIGLKGSGKTWKEEEVSFTGRGAAKYQCRREIEIVLKEGGFNSGKHISKNTIEDLKQMCQYYQNQEDRVLKILWKYKDNINKEVYTLLKADAMSEIQQGMLVQVKENYEKSSNIPKNELLEVVGYDDGLEIQAFYDKDDSYITLSPDYARYLISHTAIRLYLEKKGEVPSFEDVSEAVVDKYSGKTLEYMLAILAISSMDPHPFSSTSGIASANINVRSNFMDKILMLIKTPYIHKQIENKSHIKKGAPAYDFAFEDPAGNLVKLQDFRGKTVLMDMWFTGCGGCAEFARYLKKHIKPEFRDNEDFVIVSINVDREKETWLKSLEAEVYSEKEDVNLYNDDRYKDAGIYKYYGLNGLPFALLIDKYGKVVSHLSFGMDPKHVKNLIRETIEEKNPDLNN
ncbi:TlpA family protein disulfide reductase [Sinomicrobium pectinilyticum]|uniref:TlpA family protein disulfide reductase n=1 Tax=Sinomicrobium pectinilyticum TaxID=1084421 RepID=A0A3N0ES34_SINP1|nr:TlpA disulfide reductase family protein [Sinomicrobium pectinilyticum]RNL90676.1 TlpA family protein disulfide reductase [Sinomicrobium pectinilyticum]